MTNKHTTMIETYICPKCGLKMYVPRKKGRRRPQGHVKHMYCIRCRAKVGFVKEDL